MSTPHQKGFQPDNRRRADELHDAAPHAHSVGEQHGKQDHLTGSELSRQASEPLHEAYRHPQAAAAGHGVAAPDLTLIFERFHRVESSRSREDGGSGLGLAIAKSIVEKHLGQIWAESRPGEGLTIAFRIPLPSHSSNE